MQVSGIGTSWDYKYKSAMESNTGALSADWLNKKPQAAERRPDAVGLTDQVDSMDQDSYRYKMEMINAYETKLEQARTDDPEKYYAMLAEKEAGRCKTFRDVEQEAREGAAGTGPDAAGTGEYKGVSIHFNFFYKTMTVGDMSGDNIINAGVLSNGYHFSFNRDSMDAVVAILDMFTPEDINKIMEAVTKDNMKNNMEREIDETTAQAGQDAGAGGVAEETEAQQDALQQAGEEEPQPGEMARQDRIDRLFAQQSGQPSAAGGSKGAGTGGEAEKEEEKQITSEIVVNSDGTRNLLITTTIGENKIITKMPLSPLREHNEYHRQKGVEAYEEQMFTGVGVGDVQE